MKKRGEKAWKAGLTSLFPWAAVYCLLFFFRPFSEKIIPYHNGAVNQCQAPCQRIRNTDSEKSQSPYSKDTAQTSAYQFPYSGDNGLKTVAKTLESVAHNHQRTMNEEKSAHNG